MFGDGTLRAERGAVLADGGRHRARNSDSESLVANGVLPMRAHNHPRYETCLGTESLSLKYASFPNLYRFLVYTKSYS